MGLADDLSLVFWGGPIAFILTRKNIVRIKRVNQSMQEFFINEFGLFEVDSETQYRYGKQPMSFYNSHGTTIPKQIVKKVNKMYQKGKFFEIMRELKFIYPREMLDKDGKDLTFSSIYELFNHIVEATDHKAIDIDTEKYLPYYRAYNPISIKRLNEVCQIGRKAVDSLHPNLKPPIPIIFAIVAGIIGLAVIQNGPKYMREINLYFTDFTEAAQPIVPNATEIIPAVDIVSEPVGFIFSIVEPAQFITTILNLASSFL